MKIENFAWRFPFPKATIYIEADGRTCYAYIGPRVGERHRFSGDVWLFNIAQAPETLEWETDALMPYANAARYAHTFDPQEEVRATDFSVEATLHEGQSAYAIRLFGQTIGLIWEGASPGLSRFASQGGPLAGILASE